MEHAEATDSMAAARYLLDEMSEEERAAYEEHYFGCPACAEEVRDGSAMIDSLRATRRQKAGSVVGFRPRTAAIPWALAAAAALVVVFLGYQNAALRRAPNPQVLRSYSLLTMGTRGAHQVAIEHAGQPFALYLDIPPDPPYPNYRIEIQEPSGTARFAMPVSGGAARETLTIYIPGGVLHPGKYGLVVFGMAADGKRSPVASYPVVVSSN